MAEKVNLFIIGAQKAGTTSLYQYLNQHPEIYFSELKENLFFSQDRFYKRGLKYFHEFFKGYKTQKIKATADVQLLPSFKGPERLYDYNKDAKLIVVLRDPVKRAYSAFNFAKQKGVEKENAQFDKCFTNHLGNKPTTRKEEAAFDYFYDGLYFKHISHWLNYYDKKQILILKFEDLKLTPQKTCNTVFNFLELDSYNIEQKVHSNKTGSYRFKHLQEKFFSPNSVIGKNIGLLLPQGFKIWIRKHFITRIRQFSFVEKSIPPLDKETYKKIEDFYQIDLRQLKNELDVDLC